MTALVLAEAPISPFVFDVPVLPGDTWRREFEVWPATQSEPMDVSGWTWSAKLGEAVLTVDVSSSAAGRIVVTMSPVVTAAAKSGERFVLVGTIGGDVRTFATGLAEVGYEGSSIRESVVQKLYSDVRVDIYAAPRGDQGFDGRVAEIPGDTFIAEKVAQEGSASRSAIDAAAAALLTTPGSALNVAGNATFVSFRNYDGTPVVGKHVIIKLTSDGTGIDDITVEAL